ncbi:hypothetical protein BASA50_000688 [Batrachochytrium salamandrivorans]|uniref:Zinc finger PHD-type domain-containing protein n=1 Tax=Batrachochytrium salamandrivorans TaxID=1357716 RepID=A0ABQ8ETB5_9FUNG|nr:hypothetical protein BASA60_006188 [Batrachochytrium salamandrivorans]KAH6586223.1 hypothetical protein BASA50_000688 [Batrachochytrium salamandrivorans]
MSIEQVVTHCNSDASNAILNKPDFPNKEWADMPLSRIQKSPPFCIECRNNRYDRVYLDVNPNPPLLHCGSCSVSFHGPCIWPLGSSRDPRPTHILGGNVKEQFCNDCSIVSSSPPSCMVCSGFFRFAQIEPLDLSLAENGIGTDAMNLRLIFEQTGLAVSSRQSSFSTDSTMTDREASQCHGDTPPRLRWFRCVGCRATYHIDCIIADYIHRFGWRKSSNTEKGASFKFNGTDIDPPPPFVSLIRILSDLTCSWCCTQCLFAATGVRSITPIAKNSAKDEADSSLPAAWVHWDGLSYRHSELVSRSWLQLHCPQWALTLHTQECDVLSDFDTTWVVPDRCMAVRLAQTGVVYKTSREAWLDGVNLSCLNDPACRIDQILIQWIGQGIEQSTWELWPQKSNVREYSLFSIALTLWIQSTRSTLLDQRSHSASRLTPSFPFWVQPTPRCPLVQIGRILEQPLDNIPCKRYLIDQKDKPVACLGLMKSKSYMAPYDNENQSYSLIGHVQCDHGETSAISPSDQPSFHDTSHVTVDTPTLSKESTSITTPRLPFVDQTIEISPPQVYVQHPGGHMIRRRLFLVVTKTDTANISSEFLARLDASLLASSQTVAAGTEGSEDLTPCWLCEIETTTPNAVHRQRQRFQHDSDPRNCPVYSTPQLLIMRHMQLLQTCSTTPSVHHTPVYSRLRILDGILASLGICLLYIENKSRITEKDEPNMGNISIPCVSPLSGVSRDVEDTESVASSKHSPPSYRGGSYH